MSTKEDPYINTRAGVPVNSATVQTGVGLGRETILRLDRLRACYGRSRSFVADLALIGGGLDMLETNNASLIERFNALASDAGKTWQEYVERYVTAFGSKTYPPTVAQLEEMQWGRVPAEKRLPRPITITMDNSAATFTPATGGIVTGAPAVGESDVPPPPRGLRDVLGQ
jgi:hypothetical protein